MHKVSIIYVFIQLSHPETQVTFQSKALMTGMKKLKRKNTPNIEWNLNAHNIPEMMEYAYLAAMVSISTSEPRGNFITEYAALAGLSEG
jgi:hypothetical protein